MFLTRGGVSCGARIRIGAGSAFEVNALGSRLLCAFIDHGPGRTGEVLAIALRAGREVVMRADGGGIREVVLRLLVDQPEGHAPSK